MTSALSPNGSTWRWRRIRAEVIGPCCESCGTTENLSVDHVLERRYGGTDHPSNLRTLCVPCNSGRRGGRRGKRRANMPANMPAPSRAW